MNLEILLILIFGFHLTKGYLTPSRRQYKYIFHSIGLRIIALIAIFMVEFFYPILKFEVNLMLNVVIISLIISTCYQLYNVHLKARTHLLMSLDEEEVVSEMAQIITHGTKLQGRLILTNKRISFVSNDLGKSQYDFFLLNQNANLKINYTVGFPTKIKIPNSDLFIRVKFPFFWRREFMDLAPN